MEYIKLFNGMSIPAIGSGTNSFGHITSNYTSEYNGDFSPVGNAIKAGYRMFDSAIAYNNEDGLGTALKESGIPREELIIIDKLKIAPGYIENAANVSKAVKESLNALKTDYIDFFLLHRHWDNADQMFEAWNALDVLRKEGYIRDIAVSNFSALQVEQLVDLTGIKPAFDQHAYNSTNWNLDLIEDLKKIEISSMAYAPLHLSQEFKNKIRPVAEKYNRSWAQIILRHHYQKGIVSLPKSHSYAHALSNISIFDFTISEEDIKLIDNIILHDPIVDKSLFK